MKFFNQNDLNKKTSRELAALKEEFRKSVGNCEQQKRKGQAAQENVRKVQARRIMRPNL